MTFGAREAAVSDCSSQLEAQMGNKTTALLYILLMIVIIVAVDFLFFRNRFWERLIVNIGIVFVFATVYMIFLKGT